MSRLIFYYRIWLLKRTIKTIRKYFSEGVSVITDSEENIIAYRWTWTKILNDSVLDK